MVLLKQAKEKASDLAGTAQVNVLPFASVFCPRCVPRATISYTVTLSGEPLIVQDKAHSAAGTAQDKSKDLHGAAKDTVSKAVAGSLRLCSRYH